MPRSEPLRPFRDRLTPAAARQLAQEAEDQAGTGRAVTPAEATAMLDLARALIRPPTAPRDRRG